MSDQEVHRHSHNWQDGLWLAGISGVMALVQLPFASYVAALPLIRNEWELSNIQAGTIYSNTLAGLALAALLSFPSRIVSRPGDCSCFRSGEASSPTCSSPYGPQAL